MMSDQKDIFICHASEDKSEVVRPLVKALHDAGISYWYDEAEIKWGDSITEKVNEGLRISRYVIVVLSDAFMSKNWPQRELNSALNIEASSGEVRVLPLLAGSEEIKNRILSKYPILNDKFYLSWDHGTDAIINALKAHLVKAEVSSRGRKPTPNDIAIEIPIPDIRRKFTQRDKDLFLKRSFDQIKSYFQKGLSQLQAKHHDVETDITEIHRFKFICTIYLSGDVANKCKIWIGGPVSSDSIAYQEGDFGFDNDNSYNDWLTVNDEGPELGLKTSGIVWTGPYIKKDEILSPEKAVEYLWLRFTEHLKY